ncbi:hypothetical protein NDU88_010559 [Pleurodeles waltl]|uniref:Uncharacterized protein n=1 Tax=Pleurodeles waltl TaxID=8319 RepID=A0AAV7PYA2_PLEWA|nr:hypothetical protein NDU88_010559 [Pleurodeles waltl]
MQPSYGGPGVCWTQQPNHGSIKDAADLCTSGAMPQLHSDTSYELPDSRLEKRASSLRVGCKAAPSVPQPPLAMSAALTAMTLIASITHSGPRPPQSLDMPGPSCCSWEERGLYKKNGPSQHHIIRAPGWVAMRPLLLPGRGLVR